MWTESIPDNINEGETSEEPISPIIEAGIPIEPLPATDKKGINRDKHLTPPLTTRNINDLKHAFLKHANIINREVVFVGEDCLIDAQTISFQGKHTDKKRHKKKEERVGFQCDSINTYCKSLFFVHFFFTLLTLFY